jgi:hypothetical protein
MAFRLTKIAAVCLFLALSACQDKEDGNVLRHRSGVGVDSKIGRDLSSKQWCLPAGPNEQGHLQVEQFTFSPDGTMKIDQYVLNEDSTKLLQTSDPGTWAIVDSKLVMIRNKVTAAMTFAPAVRNNDSAPCYNLTMDGSDNSKIQQICACTL